MNEVKVLGGTFAGYTGRVMTPDDMYRLQWKHAPEGTVQVIISLFGHEVPVSIDWWLLEEITPNDVPT